MTNQNNAAQAIQEAERIAAADEYFKARTWLMDTNDNRRIFEAGFDRAYALLSKLRAPVADERAAFIEWLSGSYPTAYSEPDAVRLWHHGHVSALAWKERGRRAALASAPVAPQACPTDVCQAGKADGVLCANDECDRANGVRPASAPVADERDRHATISEVFSRCALIPGATLWNAAQLMYDEMHRRAALSAQPGAQRTGGSDAG